MIRAVIYFTSGLSMESIASKEAVEKVPKTFTQPVLNKGKIITIKGT